MSMWKQVWHVMKKDLRQFRWLIVMQVMATGMAINSAIGPAAQRGEAPWITREFAIQGFWSAMMMFLAVVLTVSVIQADSPSSSDAFWATKPFRPLAVLLAKALLIVGVTFAIPTAGEIFALADRGIVGTQALTLVADGAALLFALLLAAAVLAALTADMTTFLAAGVTAWFGAAGFGFIIWRFLFQGAYSEMTSVPVAGLGALLGCSILAYQYQRRNVRRSVWATVVGCALGGVLLGAMSTPPTPATMATVPDQIIRTDVVWGDFDIEPLPRFRIDGGAVWALRTTIELGEVDPRYEYAFHEARARLTLADGTELERNFRGPLLSRSTGTLVAAAGDPAAGAGDALSGSEWTIGSVPDFVSERLVVAHLTQAQLDLLRSEGGELELIRTWVDVKEAREIGTMPLDPSSTLEDDGQTFTIESVGTAGSAGAMAGVRWERVREDMGRQIFLPLDYVGYAFVDPSSRTGVLAPYSREYTLGRSAVFLGGWSTLTYEVAVETPTVFEDGQTIPARSSEWFAESELLLIGVSSIGTYPLEASTEVRDITMEGEDGR